MDEKVVNKEIGSKEKVNFLAKVLFYENPRNKMFKALVFFVFSLAMAAILSGGWAGFFIILSFIFLLRTIQYFIEWRKEEKY